MSDSEKPSDVLNRQFDLTGVNTEPSSLQSTQLELRGHGFFVGGIGLLLETEKHVCEVFDDLQLCRLPNTASWLCGIANQRGNMVPIFDLERLLDLEVEDEKKIKRNILIYGKKERAVGMLVDGMPMRVALEEEELLRSMPPLPTILQPFVKHSYEKSGKIWVVWDIFEFFETMRERVAA